MLAITKYRQKKDCFYIFTMFSLFTLLKNGLFDFNALGFCIFSYVYQVGILFSEKMWKFIAHSGK